MENSPMTERIEIDNILHTIYHLYQYTYGNKQVKLYFDIT